MQSAMGIGGPYWTMHENVTRSRVVTLWGVLKGGKLGLLLWLTLCPTAFAGDGNLPMPAWTQVRLEASQGFAKARTEVTLRPAPDAPLIEGGKGRPIEPNGGSVMLAKAEIRAKLPFKRKHWIGWVWFDGTSGAAAQRVRLKLGKDPSRKSYRFGRDGIHRVVAKPRDASESKLEADAWTDVRHVYFPYPSTRPGCEDVSDPLLLLVLAGDLGSGADSHKTVCVFNKKTLYRADLETEGTEKLQVRYDLKTGGGQASKEGVVTATKVRVSAKLVDPQAPNRDDFEFLGLEGEISIWVDRATGLPLAVDGELPDVGPGRFKLTAANLP